MRFLQNLDVTSLNTNLTSTSENCRGKINRYMLNSKTEWIQKIRDTTGQAWSLHDDETDDEKLCAHKQRRNNKNICQ